NYVSVMNYQHAYGIPQTDPNGGQDFDGSGTGSGYITDYSPPRFMTPAGLTRGPAPLASLVESSLHESTVLASVDPANPLLFTNGKGALVQSPLNGDINKDGSPDGVDWTGNGNTTDGAGLAVNIDNSGGVLVACANTTIQSTPMTGHDDWSNLSLAFGQFGDS